MRGTVRVTLVEALEPDRFASSEWRLALRAGKRRKSDPDPLRKYRPVRDALAVDALGPWARFGRAAAKPKPKVRTRSAGAWRPVFDPLAISQTPIRGWTAADADLEGIAA